MKRWYFLAIAALAIVLVPPVMLESIIYSRVLAVAGLCLLLWLSEVVPPFVPTLLLWTLIPILLGPLDAGKFSVSHVLSWAVDPVMALFFGGFVLGAATEAQGLDKRLAAFALNSSKGSFGKLLLFAMGLTAFLSMWMSNIAAAALVFAGLQPILSAFDEDHILRRTLLIGVALGADLGGMATPIGTGPNAIAIAAISPTQQISFVSWMAFAIPLTVGMLVLSYFFILWRSGGFRSSGVGSLPTQTIVPTAERSSQGSKRDRVHRNSRRYDRSLADRTYSRRSLGCHSSWSERYDLYIRDSVETGPDENRLVHIAANSRGHYSWPPSRTIFDSENPGRGDAFHRPSSNSRAIFALPYKRDPVRSDEQHRNRGFSHPARDGAYTLTVDCNSNCHFRIVRHTFHRQHPSERHGIRSGRVESYRYAVAGTCIDDTRMCLREPDRSSLSAPRRNSMNSLAVHSRRC